MSRASLNVLLHGLTGLLFASVLILTVSSLREATSFVWEWLGPSYTWRKYWL